MLDYAEGGKKEERKDFACVITPSVKRRSVKTVAWFLPAQEWERRLDPSFGM